MLASVDFSSLLLSLGTATDESLCSPVDLPLFMYGCVMITRLRDATPSASDPRFFFFFFDFHLAGYDDFFMYRWNLHALSSGHSDICYPTNYWIIIR